MGIDVWVHDVLSITFVGIQQSMFKLAIKSNVLDAIVKPTSSNILTQLWHIPLIIKAFSYFFLAYFKLLKIAMVQVLGSMEDVHCFRHSKNSSDAINSLTTCVQWLEYSTNFFHPWQFSIYMNNGVANIFDIQWELDLSKALSYAIFWCKKLNYLFIMFWCNKCLLAFL